MTSKINKSIKLPQHVSVNSDSIFRFICKRNFQIESSETFEKHFNGNNNLLRLWSIKGKKTTPTDVVSGNLAGQDHHGNPLGLGDLHMFLRLLTELNLQI